MLYYVLVRIECDVSDVLCTVGETFLSSLCISVPDKLSVVDVDVDNALQQATFSWAVQSGCAATGFFVTVYDAASQVVYAESRSSESAQLSNLEQCVDLRVGVTPFNALGNGTESDLIAFRLERGKREYSQCSLLCD